MKFCLIVAQSADVEELGVSGFCLSKNTYKTEDNFILETEVIRNKEKVVYFTVSCYEDVANILDISLVNRYALKHGIADYKKIEKLEPEFLDLFEPNEGFIKSEFVLSLDDFLELEKSLLGTKNSYKEITLPEALKDLETSYSSHNAARKLNMSYNLYLSSELSKAYFANQRGNQ